MATTTLGQKTVGSTVKLKVNGTLRDFIIVNQGRPSNLYDTSCDGTWLLMKDCYEQRAWHSSNLNDYANSTIHAYLNGDFLKLFEANIQAAIKQVKIPYRPGSGTSPTVSSGASGLSCKIFLLGGYEMGWTTSDNQYFPVDGAKLSYFDSGTGTAANNKRIANYNDSAVLWWLRSPYLSNSDDAWRVYSYGYYNNNYCSGSYGIRPALILSSSLLVSDDGSVSTNTAPSMPGSITIPSSIAGGSTITIQWAASTDAEKNLAGYYVEKSINGGNSWTQIYQGTATNTTDQVMFGTPSVMYRVKAYDSEGLQSAWKQSNQVTVVNNVAPGAPASISVPNEVKGGASLVVSWGAASDSDGNLDGYELERCINGGSDWTQVYKGPNLSFSDTITKGWTKVKYRVRAYDKLNATSGYTTSAERTVDNNTTPTITCEYADNTDLGEKTSGFTISYSVDDEDATDTLTVTETLDGVQKRQFAGTRKQNNSFQVTGDYFQKVLNGKHTLVISVSDGKVTATRTLTFTKAVHTAKITLEAPMDADDKITICAITVTGTIPSDAAFKVEVTNNAKDDSPVWEDATDAARTGRNHLFENQTATKGFAFNFRVTATRGISAEGGNITSVQGGFQ